MTSSEAFGAQLSRRLGLDLEGLRTQRQKGERAVTATDQAIAELEAGVAQTRERLTAELAVRKEEVASVTQVAQIVTAFHTEGAALAREVKKTSEQQSRARSEARSIRERIEMELTEAHGRLRGADRNATELRAQLEQLDAECEPAEKKAEAELAQLSNAASAASLKAQIGRRCFEVLEAELQRMEGEAGEVRRHAERRARAEETREQLRKETRQLEVDRAAVRRLEAKEKEVEEGEAEGAAKDAKMEELLEAQIAPVRRLVLQQQSFLDSKIQPREGTAPAEAALLEKAAQFARGQVAVSQAALERLEEEKKTHAKASAAARERRIVELRQIRAEKQAVAVAVEHREKFVGETEAQLQAAEAAEAAEAAGREGGRPGFEGREMCMGVVRGDLEESAKVCEALRAAEKAACAARDDKAQAVEELVGSNRARRSALQVRIECEASVVEQQQGYVASLRSRLRQPALQVPQQAEGAEGELGRRGEATVGASAAAVGGLLAQLQEDLRAREEAHASATGAREQAGREGALEGRRLNEQRTAMAEAMAKLESYERELTEKLARLPPAEAAPSPTAATSAPPAPSTRASHMVELEPLQKGAEGVPEAPSPPVDLSKLRSSAEIADQASLLIDRVSRALDAQHGGPQPPRGLGAKGAAGSRPESPVAVVSSLEVSQRQ